MLQITEQNSKRITSLRFLLIVLVIFIHNNGSEVANTVVSGAVRLFFSEILARVAVPLFFFFSGYLLFCKPRLYREVLVKKAKTLLLPYLLWNGLVVMMFWLGQTAPVVSAFFNDENNRIANYTLYQWGDAFLGLNYQGYPAAYQLWFIRDLIILVLLYPIGKKLADCFPGMFLTGLVMLWVMQWRLLFFSSEAALFFMLGYYAVRVNAEMDMFDALKTTDVTLAYGICVIAEWMLVLRGMEFMMLHKLGIVLGCIFWLRMSKQLITSEKGYHILEYLAGCSFFVYAAHEPFLTMLRKVWSMVLPLESTTAQLVQYFGLIFAACVVTLVAGVVLRKLCPRFYGVLTGGRDG